MSLLEESPRPPWPWQEPCWRRLCAERQAGKLAHAQLIYGEAGTGRAGFALEFGKFLLCHSPVDGRACYQCRSCRAGGAEHHPDLLPVQPDEGRKDIGIAGVRAIGEFLSRSSFAGKGRVAVILRAERMTLAASNALLKTLEEPAENSYLLLTGGSPGGFLPTIRSRCRLLPLPRPDSRTAGSWLRERLPEDAYETPEQLEELLAAFGNQPLRLLEGAGGRQIAGFLSAQKMLLDLIEERVPLRQAVKDAAKSEASTLFGHLALISTILTRRLVDGNPRDATHRTLAAAIRELTTASGGEGGAALLRSLLEFQYRVAEARILLIGPGNPNPQFLLEGVFRHWRGLGMGRMD